MYNEDSRNDILSAVLTGVGYIVLMVLVVGLLMWFIPWAAINSLNQLFTLGIDHGFWTYVSFWVIWLLLGPRVKVG